MAHPRYETELDESLPNWSEEILLEAERLDVPLMDWQIKGAKLLGALKEDGVTPRYDTVVITVPRQSGKTTLAQACLSAVAKRQDNQRLYITAQTRTDAVKHLENLGRAASEDLEKALLGTGRERLLWWNGSQLEVIPPTATAAHGMSIDFMLLDEVWALQPHVMAGVIPATVAKPNHQLLFISTMGTVESTVWNDLVSRGRESVSDSEATVAYLEYAAPSEEAVFDEEQWPDFMPALGTTVSVEAVRSSQNALHPNEFVRAFGNRVTTTLTSIFPSEWVEAAWRQIEPPKRFVVAVDVNDEPAGASLTTAHMTDEGVAARVIDWRFGTPTWLPVKLREVLRSREVEAVVADLGGPTRQVAAELKAICEEFYVPLVDRKPREVAGDTLSFYDSLREKRVLLEKSTQLEEALTAAYRKPYGDMWLITRSRMLVDASPLISVVLACGLANELDVKPVVKPAIY